MSRSPIKDYSKLFETNAKTVKKEQIRREESSSKKYQNQSALSYQSRYDVQSFNFLNDIKGKLDAALMHNTRLLDENSLLGQMANELRYQLKAANDKLTFFQKESDNTITKTTNERQHLQIQLDFKQKNQEEELARLLQEINNLHAERNTLEISKDKEIERLKSVNQTNLITQVQNLRNIQNNSKDLYEIQIKNLKDNLDQKQRQLQSMKAVQKLQKTRLTDEIKSLQNQVKYMKNFYNIELQSIKHNYDNQVKSQKRRLEHEKEIQQSGFNLKVKKLRKDVLEKNLQMQNMNKRMIFSEEIMSVENDQFKKEKELMLSELKSNAIHAKNQMTKEKVKLEELNRLEVQNLTKLFETNIQELNGQNFKLKLLIQCKKSELKQLYDENQMIKESYNKENELIRNQNNELKKMMKDKELEFKGEIQTFKIKLANLLEYDIKSLSNYYEHQIKAYIDKVHEFEKIISGLKDKLYNGIMENDQIRKQFELQISKQRARVQDLKIKMATIQLQHKEHVSNLGSKVQLTSQTLIRQSEHSEKTKGQYEQEKKKYHYLANTKDKEISDLMALMENLKKLHETELKNYRSQKGDLRDQLQSALDENKRIKVNADELSRIKDEKIKSITFSNEKELQEIKDLQDKIQILQKNHMKLKKQYDHMQMVHASIAQELGLSKGFIENLQLESSAAIEDERTRMKAFLGTHEIGIREYYQDKIKSKQKDIQGLKKMLVQKEEDVRDIVVKYNALQKRFDIMMQTTTKLRQFQEQVKHLGLDNNLVKNMAELFKK